MVGCESKGARRSHSGLWRFFPLLPGSAASLFSAAICLFKNHLWILLFSSSAPSRMNTLFSLRPLDSWSQLNLWQASSPREKPKDL